MFEQKEVVMLYHFFEFIVFNVLREGWNERVERKNEKVSVIN